MTDSPSKKPPSKTTYAHKKKRQGSTDKPSDVESANDSNPSPALKTRKPVSLAELPGPTPRSKPPQSDSKDVPPQAKPTSPPDGVESAVALAKKKLAARAASPSYVSEAENSRPIKARRLTEEERKAYFDSQPDVSELEAHRALCRACEKWVPLHQSTKYALAPWNVHKRSCPAKKPFPRTAIKKSEGEESSTERGARAEDSDDASSIAPSASASDAPSALVGKRRSLAERRRILEEDPAAGELRENEVFCSECKKWVKLSSRTKYEIKKWNTHIIRNHGRSIEDHANEMPSDRVREAERKLQLVNDPLVEDFTTKRVTCLKCQADIILHSSIPYQLDNWYTHKQTCSQGDETQGAIRPANAEADPADIPLPPSPSIASLPPLSVIESTVSRDATPALQNSASMSSRKRIRDDDEESTTRRVRTRVSSLLSLDKPPSGPWGWLKLPWETFKKGFAEGLGIAEAEGSSSTDQ